MSDHGGRCGDHGGREGFGRCTLLGPVSGDPSGLGVCQQGQETAKRRKATTTTLAWDLMTGLPASLSGLHGLSQITQASA